jgi:hypothetical protein
VDDANNLTHTNDPNNCAPYQRPSQRVPVSANAHKFTMATTTEGTAPSDSSVLEKIHNAHNWRKTQLEDLNYHATKVEQMYTKWTAHAQAVYAAITVVSRTLLQT